MAQHPQTNSNGPIHRTSFGIGCWDFGIPCEASSRFSVDQYVALLKEGLETVSSLNNLDIVQQDHHDNVTLDSTHAKQDDDGMTIFSHGVVWRIDFDLYIPLRIQKDLAGRDTQWDTGTENFRIHVRHSFYSPITFVRLLGTDKSNAPSTAMVVVREYLQTKCAEPSSDLRFTCLGPTPFHADLHIEPDVTPDAARNKSRGFGMKRLDPPGYSDITFYYSTSYFDAIQTALDKLMDELDGELDTFYAIVSRNSDHYRHWNHIENLFSGLIERSRRTGWRQLVAGVHAHSREVQELSIALARFQADYILDEHATQKAFRDTYKNTASAYLRDYVEAEMEGRPTFPTTPVADLLGFLERRRSKALELLVILAAAIVGGVAGSLLTILTSQ